MATNKQFRNNHAKNYIQAVFAERLQEEGFSCPDDRLLCWYRVVNNEIINSICFFSSWSNVPISMAIGYGIYPLFVQPFHYSNVYLSAPPNDERFYCTHIQEGDVKWFEIYSEYAQVYCPRTDGRGIGIFNDFLLPQMNAVQSVEQCYRINRKLYHGNYAGMSPTLIDEAIYLNDISAFDNCRRANEKLIRLYEKEVIQHPSCKAHRDMLANLQMQKVALLENRREDYLLNLERRKKKTIALLEKKYGIVVPQAFP